MTEAIGYARLLKEVRQKAHECGRSADDIAIVAVSKNYPVAALDKVYLEGARDFGESRIQEALNKIPQMPNDCRWHLVGSLQSKKVVKAVSSFHLIHSVDTPDLAQTLSHASEKLGVVTSILLQVNTSGESSKHGLSGEAWGHVLHVVDQLPHLHIEGLMTMAPFTEERDVIRNCFRKLRMLRDRWRTQMRDPVSFKHLSMGMSHDYLIAIEEGATLLRIGTALFGDQSLGV